nr:hypothetical protein [Sphingomonas psychrolutea]
MIMPLTLLCSGNVNFSHHLRRLRTDQVDRKKAIAQACAENVHAFFQKKDTLKLARRDTTKKELGFNARGLATTNDELFSLHRHVEFAFVETCHRKGDAQAVVFPGADGEKTLDIERRVTVIRPGMPAGRWICLV